MEDELRARLNEAKRKARKRRKPYQEVVLAHVLMPVIQEWLDKQPRPDAQARTWDRSDRVYGELADMARVPPRRLYGLLHGEDVSVNLDTADRLMTAINQHISFIEEGIVTTLEADAYARWQREQIRVWWETIGNTWPEPREMRRWMTRIRRAYYQAHKEVAA